MTQNYKAFRYALNKSVANQVLSELNATPLSAQSASYHISTGSKAIAGNYLRRRRQNPTVTSC